MKKALLPILTFAKIDIRRTFRDKVALFFTFVFPLIFLFIFGGLFGKNDNPSFNVALVNQSQTSFAADFVKQAKESKILKVNDKATDLDSARQRMDRDEVDATIVLPESFGAVADKAYPTGQARVIYNQNNEQAAQTLATVLDGIFKEINKQFVPADTPFTVATESTAREGLNRFDYTFAGLLGFSILGLGIFGPTTVFPQLKKQGVLRRYHTTTLRVWQYFVANALSSAAIGIMSVAAMFVVGVLVFDLNMKGDFFSLAALVILGVGTLFGIGLAVGGWAQNENQAAPLANLITFPMMFLSGTFFPRFLMPEWLQNVSGLLPLTPVIDGARLIITEGRTFFDILPQVGLLAGWAVIIYAIAFRVFRWE